MQTTSELFDKLDPGQIEQAIRLVRSYKRRFAYVARAVMDEAEASDIDADVARMVVMGECLLLAAYMYTDNPSERGDFIKIAGSAFDLAISTMVKKQ